MNELIDDPSEFIDEKLLNEVKEKVKAITSGSPIDHLTFSKLQAIADEHSIPIDHVNDVYSTLVNLPLLD